MAGCHPSPIHVPQLVSFGAQEAANLRQNFPGPELVITIPTGDQLGQAGSEPHETGDGAGLLHCHLHLQGKHGCERDEHG